MVNSHGISKLLVDRWSLEAYERSENVSIEDVKRHLFLAERETDKQLPDHYYKRSMETFFKLIPSKSHLLKEGLIQFSCLLLREDSGIISVKKENWEDWQNIITGFPPIVLISAFLADILIQNGINPNNIAQVSGFIKDWIIPNVRYTCLLNTNYPQMSQYQAEKGFHDLHIHLNGSTETDHLWQTALRNPYHFYYFLKKSTTKGFKVKEQYEELYGKTELIDNYQRFHRCKTIRSILVQILFSYEESVEDDSSNMNDFCYQKIPYLIKTHSHNHDLSRYFNLNKEDCVPDLVLECLFHVLMISQLSRFNNESDIDYYHYYLLVLGRFNSFVVQQTHQVGFDQFQKLTINSFRDNHEKSYQQRYYQLHGNSLNNLKHLEGRFSGKKNVPDAIQQIRKITAPVLKNKMSFSLHLVNHLIKETDKEKIKPDNYRIIIRHRKKRKQLVQLVRVYSSINFRKTNTPLVGFDSASNELETPPEVFAPAYHYLRKKGYHHFTFHAGEDFHHLIGGLRAIYEAVEFLGFENGDRIGHGTALGIDPDLWVSKIQNELYLSPGEWLDDMVFTYYLIMKSKNSQLHLLIPKLAYQIEIFCQKVYHSSFTIEDLISCWKYRKYSPYYFFKSESGCKCSDLFVKADYDEVIKFMRQFPHRAKIMRMYHTSHYRHYYHNPKEAITINELFEPVNLRELQKIMLDDIVSKEIVIEVLPTSNVRISFYKKYKEHHIWRFLDLKNEIDEKNPIIVIGTDDTGIFATNIYNEYLHLYHCMIQDFHLNHTDAMNVIETLEKNSKKYKFRK